MPIELADKWIWDAWYVREGDRWHAFFLQADRSLGDPELRHWNVSIGHAVSRDLSAWEHLGTCFGPADTPAWDDFTTWTGSVVRGDDARWHLFYTGTSRAERGLIQRIGHAVSDDLHRWERVGAACLDLVGPAAAQYETAHAVGVWHDRAMRDPWVLRDPGGDGWLMVFTARVPGIAEVNAAGAIGLATSPDLGRWQLQAPVFAGGYGQLEVPQIFAAEGRWYCLFCTAAEHFSAAQAAAALPGGPVTGTHYLLARDPRGPWQIAPGFLDGALPCRRYAGRVVEGPEGPVMLGFVDRPEGRFVGTIADPVPVRVGADGLLRLGRPRRSGDT